MLYAGSDDGVYRVVGVTEPAESTVERVLDAGRVYRVRQFDDPGGLFAAAESGLYHSPEGEDWTQLAVPEDKVYSVVASPSGDRLYAGTRPARVFVTETAGGLPAGADDWRPLSGFEDLRAAADWGIPRHDGEAGIRSLCTHPETPDLLVAGLEVGGVFVSDDRGRTWSARHVEGYDEDNLDDVHHLALGECSEFVASTGGGLYLSTDTGRTWMHLDADHSQWYFREALVRGDVVYAGGAHGPSTTWDDDTDHGLFEFHGTRGLRAVESPVPREVAIGWCVADDTVLAATHMGTLLARGDDDDYRAVGSVPTPGAVRGRYLPLAWFRRDPPVTE